MKKKEPMPASLGDIARMAGVSKATACYVLRNRPGPSPATRDLVLRVARQLGYSPDPRVASWMARVRDAKGKDLLPLAWLNTNPEKDAWEKYKFFTPYLEGARERAAQLGYRIEEVWAAQPGLRMQDVSRIIHQRGIEGVIISHNARHVRLDWEGVAAVALEHSLLVPRLDHVETDIYFNLHVALKMVRRHGYRRIGICLDNNVDQHTHHSCRALMYHFHASIPRAEQITPFYYVGEAGKIYSRREKTVAAWLHRQRPDVVIGHSNYLLGWVRAAGYRVPGDIGVVHLATDDDVADWAGIHSNRRQIGASAVARVISRLQYRQFGIPKIAVNFMIPGRWHPGKTLLIPKPK